MLWAVAWEGGGDAVTLQSRDCGGGTPRTTCLGNCGTERRCGYRSELYPSSRCPHTRDKPVAGGATAATLCSALPMWCAAWFITSRWAARPRSRACLVHATARGCTTHNSYMYVYIKEKCLWKDSRVTVRRLQFIVIVYSAVLVVVYRVIYVKDLMCSILYRRCRSRPVLLQTRLVLPEFRRRTSF